MLPPSAFLVRSNHDPVSLILVFPLLLTREWILPYLLSYQTIRPNSPLAISSVAWPPKRVARLRSNGEGFPPRWVYPNTVSRSRYPFRLDSPGNIIRRTLFIRSLDTLGYYNDGIKVCPCEPDPRSPRSPYRYRIPIPEVRSRRHLQPSRHTRRSIRHDGPSPPRPSPAYVN